MVCCIIEMGERPDGNQRRRMHGILTIIRDLDERIKWKTERSKEPTIQTADRTTTLIKLNNKGDECSGREMNWQKASGGTEKRNWEASQGKYKINVNGTSGTR